MIRRSLLLFGLLLLLASAAASAQTPAPAVDEIIQKSIDARGGLQKLKAIKSIKATGKILPAGLAQEIPVTMIQRRPMAFRMDLTVQGKSLVQAYDGESGWQINPFQGPSDPEKLAGDDLKDAQEQADMDGPLVDYKAKGHSVELAGKEDLEGTPVYKLKLTLKTGDIRYIYIDAENYLELKITSKRKSPGGEIEIDTYASNYKPVGGVLFPFSIEQKMKGQTQAQITIDKYELDVPVDEASFKMPQKTEKPAEKPPDKPGDEKAKEKPPLQTAAILPASPKQGTLSNWSL